MYLIIAFIILALIFYVVSKLYLKNREKIQFYIDGFDQGFKMPEISILWRVAQLCNLEEPVSLFFSLPSLTKCITQIKESSEIKGSENNLKFKQILTKLYEYRNKIEKDADKKRGLESTRSLNNGQKLRIILPGKGVFSSEIVNNGRDLIISLPTQKGQINVESKAWLNQTVNVYLWRTGDARYVFDTKVLGESLFLGKPSLHLEHTVNLIRTQKRNAVRAKCHIAAQLYIINESEIDFSKVETKSGYRCVVEDISEKGALIRIGGKGKADVQLRIQFQLQNRFIIMFGIVRTVEFNEEKNQSRLHFECIHIDNDMKNQILSYVYNILPENEKEIYDALTYTDLDAKVDLENNVALSDEKAKEISENLNDAIPEYTYDNEDPYSEDNEDYSLDDKKNDDIDSSELDSTDELTQ